MEPEISDAPVEWELAGLSCRRDPVKSFGEQIMALLGRVWPVIRSSGARHDGINRVVYDADCTVFVGVKLDVAGVGGDLRGLGLETKSVRLARHAYGKHVGPYRLIERTGDQMRA